MPNRRRPPTPAPVAEPVPAPRRARPRHDGLTPERQRLFFETLAATGCVSHAADACGLSKQALYAHRNRDDCPAFRAAWQVAVRCAINLLADHAIERAIAGVEEPVFWQGTQVGTRRRYNDRLTMALLASHPTDTPERITIAHGRVTRHRLRPPLDTLLAALDIEAAGAASDPAYDDDPGGAIEGDAVWLRPEQ